MDKINILAPYDNLFSRRLSKSINDTRLEKDLSSLLTTNPIDADFAKMQFNICIVSDKKEPFFGFSIYPMKDHIFEMCKELNEENTKDSNIITKWHSINHWYIEIDERCFDRNVITLNPQEITAMLLHELGHVISSNVVIERVYRKYRDACMKATLTDRELVRFGNLFLSIALSGSCVLKSWRSGKNNARDERAADKYAVKCGYRDHLASAIAKIIITFGNSSIDIPEAELDKSVERQVEWAFVQTKELVYRQKKLKDSVIANIVRTSSGFVKNLYLDIMKKVGGSARDGANGIVTECTLENIFDTKYDVFFDHRKFGTFESTLITIANESINNAKRKGVKLPSEYDIDTIEVEIDRISNHHDRIYVLDLIYNQIEYLESYLEIANDMNETQSNINKARRMIDRLNVMRNEVLKKKTFGTKYGVFVKVPAGYEG